MTPGAPPDVPPGAGAGLVAVNSVAVPIAAAATVPSGACDGDGVAAANLVVVLPNSNVKASAVGKAVIDGIVACVVPNQDPDPNINFRGGVGGACIPNPNVNFTGVVGSVFFFVIGGIGGVFFFFSVNASFSKVSTGTNKLDIVVSGFETFTLIPTCEFIDFKFSSRRQLLHISRDQVQGLFRSTSLNWLALRYC